MCGKKIAALTHMRDLGVVFDHEEPLLHPTCDHAQQNMRDEGYEASPVLRFIVAGCARLRFAGSQPRTFESIGSLEIIIV
jgi:hypothetical protein